MVEAKTSMTKEIEVDLELVRAITLDNLRNLVVKFKRKYGTPVLAVDSTSGSWRKSVFPYYKARRAENRNKSAIDWQMLLNNVNQLKKEITETFPYAVIEVKHAEADDIIGVLTKYTTGNGLPTMIVSRDKDFIQLQINTELVNQFDKTNQTLIAVEDPKRYMFNHVLSGDSGDGIPNILSAGDSYVTKTRCKPMTQKRLDQFWDNKQMLLEDPALKERFLTNRQLIDLSFTPEEIKQQILDQYNNYQYNDNSKIKNYLVNHRLRKLYENIGDFYV